MTIEKLITTEKIKIFEQYQGTDYDRIWAKHSKKISYEELMLIDRLIQDIGLISKGLAAETYKQQIDNMLLENCDNNSTIDYLKSVSAQITDPGHDNNEIKPASLIGKIIKKLFG